MTHYEIPKNKDEYFQLPPEYRIRLKRSFSSNPNFIVNDLTGNWTPDIETALGAYHSIPDVDKRGIGTKIISDMNSQAAANPNIGKIRTTTKPEEAKKYVEEGKNPVLAYIESLQPKYDKEKEKRLKNLAIVEALGNIVKSAVMLRGASKGSPAVAPATNAPYIASTLREMADKRDQLEEGYKMLSLQELIRQQGLKEDYDKLDYQYKKRKDESDDEYQNRVNLLNQQQAFSQSERIEEQRWRDSYLKTQQQNRIGEIEAQGNKQIDVNKDLYDKKTELEDAKATRRHTVYLQKAARDYTKDKLPLSDSVGNIQMYLTDKQTQSAYQTIMEGLKKNNPELIKSDPSLLSLSFNSKPSQNEMNAIVLRFWDEIPDVKLFITKQFGGNNQGNGNESKTSIQGSLWEKQ
jgi:hypothetical protein